MFRSVSDLIQITKERNIPISEVMIEQEIEESGKSREDIFAEMERNLDVMEKQ